MTEPQPKKSDLRVRVASALVMVAVTGAALWMRGYAWAAFVALVGLGVFWEWSRLSTKFTRTPSMRAIWLIGGLIYIGLAACMLIYMNSARFADRWTVVLPIGAVIATDIGAYFAGRTIGGPKIAPKISPSKTWSGLLGGIVLAATVMVGLMPWTYHDFDPQQWQAAAFLPAVGGAMIAITAQTGDFFESWMKRLAGVKDSGNLLPGHGGLFDRVDGLLAVAFIGSLVVLPDILRGMP